MEFSNLLISRNSIRDFLPNSVSDSIITQIVEAVSRSVSAKNVQPYYFISITNRDLIKIVSEYTYSSSGKTGQGFNKWVENSPAILVQVLTEPHRSIKIQSKRKNIQYALIDYGAALQIALLKIVDLGMGGCVATFIKDDVDKEIDGKIKRIKLSEVLQLSESERAIELIGFGYYDKNKVCCKTLKKTVDELLKKL